MDYYHHYSVPRIAGWIPENLQWLLHELMTNGDCITVRWISQYLANWWKCHIWPIFPHTHPIQGLHPVFSRLLPFGDWLTSDGWLADGSRCTHGTSSAWFHNVSLPPLSLVNITCRVGVFKEVQMRTAAHPHTWTFAMYWYLPLISLVNLTLWESVSGRGCSSMLWMSSTSHMNWMTGWAL